MRKAVLYFIAEPKEAGENPKMYYVEGHLFSTLIGDAHIFESKEEVEKIQAEFPMDMQLEYLEH